MGVNLFLRNQAPFWAKIGLLRELCICIYELAEEYADDDEDKEAIGKLRKRVLKRLRNMDKLISEWGFEPPKEHACDDATLKYTEFLMETASRKVGGEKFAVKIITPFEKTKLAAYTLSAISPCMRLYSFISKETQALLDPNESNHIYKKWLDNLSSEKFEVCSAAGCCFSYDRGVCLFLPNTEVEGASKTRTNIASLFYCFKSRHQHQELKTC